MPGMGGTVGVPGLPAVSVSSPAIGPSGVPNPIGSSPWPGSKVSDCAPDAVVSHPAVAAGSTEPGTGGEFDSASIRASDDAVRDHPRIARPAANDTGNTPACPAEAAKPLTVSTASGVLAGGYA